MPGTGDGSSFQNATEWDHTQYQGGTRVFGNTTHYFSGPGHWWQVKLKAGIEYTFQTRIPSFRAYLYLYNDLQQNIGFGFGNGDDGSLYAKIVYTTLSDGDYYLWVRGYNFLEIGGYSLESVPPPVLEGTFATQGSSFSSREQSVAATPILFDVLRDPTAFSKLSSVFDSRGRSENGQQIVFDVRNFQQTQLSALFDSIGYTARLIVSSTHDSRGIAERKTGIQLDARAVQTSQTYALFKVIKIIFSHLGVCFGVREVSRSLQSIKCNSLVRPGWSIYARDALTSAETFLGFINEDASSKELIDVPLADGTYEIEVRPHQYFWENCRGRKVTTLVVGSGSVGSTGLPSIQNLTREIVSFVSRIKWKIAEEYAPGTFQFGLWFSPTTPVDTSGLPNQTVGYSSGIGEYQYTRNQTDSEYVAVAAFTPTETGQVGELYLPWSTNIPRSPDDQYVNQIAF